MHSPQSPDNKFVSSAQPEWIARNSEESLLLTRAPEIINPRPNSELSRQEVQLSLNDSRAPGRSWASIFLQTVLYGFTVGFTIRKYSIY